MAQNVPYNLESEQSILGCVLIDNEIMVSLSDEMKVQDFYDRRHQIIYTAMLNIYKNQMQIDFTTLIAELQIKNQLVEAGGAVYLSSLIDAVYTTANIADYIQIVQDAALKRNVIAAATSIAEAGYNANYDSAGYIDYAERLLSDLAKRRRTEGFASIDTVLENVKNIMLANRARDGELTGLSTGFEKLDEISLGLQKDNLIILAARPAMGKSAFAMNIAINAATNNVKQETGEPVSVAIFSLEMSQEQIVQRMTAAKARVNLNSIQKGTLNQKEMLLVESANDDLAGLNIYFCDQGTVTVADIRAKCRKQKASGGLDLVIIDYLQLINGSTKSGNRQEEVANISRSLKQMARELGVPVIALSQLSRKLEEREDKRPNMSDLRESGSIEQDADIIMFLYRDGYYNKNTEKHNTLINELNFKINIRKRENGWSSTEIGNDWYTGGSNGNTNITDIDFNDDDIKYQKSSLKNTFLRLSFYDTPSRGNQKLLFYSTVFLDSNKISHDFFAKNIVSDLEFNIKNSFENTACSEGYYLYLYPKWGKADIPTEIYMKIEFNHAKFGKTVPLVLPSTDAYKEGYIDTDNEYSEGINNLFNDMYIKVNTMYDSKTNKYIWFIPNDEVNDNVNKTITMTLYEPIVNKINESGYN